MELSVFLNLVSVECLKIIHSIYKKIVIKIFKNLNFFTNSKYETGRPVLSARTDYQLARTVW
jgi:predicted nucleic acid-binding protein